MTFDDSYYVARPIEIAAFNRYYQLPTYKTRNEFLNNTFGDYSWDAVNKNILIKAPDIAENSNIVPVRVEGLNPLSEKSSIFLFAEYRYKGAYKYERLAKIEFNRSISLYSSRYILPTSAFLFVVLQDRENNEYSLSPHTFTKIFGHCGGVSVATEEEADRLNIRFCGSNSLRAKNHPACARLSN